MPSMREIQEFEFSILEDVTALCEKYHIKYYLSSGTLLGAVRHKGFIPWDNDIDIDIPVKDYRRFLKIARKELPERYFVQNYTTDPCYNDLYTKIRVNNTTSLPIIWKNLEIHWGMGIDIFPLIGVYKNHGLAKIQAKLFSVNKALVSKDMALATCDNTWKHSFLLRVLYFMPRKIRHLLCQISEKFVFKSFRTSDEIALVWQTLDLKYRKELYLPTTRLEFEGKYFMAPKNYDYILKQQYGDYMIPPPESERNGHEDFLGKIIYDLKCDYSIYQNEMR